MRHISGGPDASAAVVRGRLDVEVAERRLVEDFAIHDAIERYPPGQADCVDAGLGVQVVQHAEHDFLESLLEACRDVVVSWVQRGLGTGTRRAEKALHTETPKRRQFG